MSKEENKDVWEYDRERIIGAILIVIIIIGASALVVMSMPKSEPRNVAYTITESRDTDRIDLVYRTFFGDVKYIENASLFTVKLQVADIPDVMQAVISVYTILPMQLMALVVSEYPAEGNVLHGQNQIPTGQTNYAVTLNVGQRNLVVYMFFENTGSFEFVVNLF